ncbi:SPOR domain-containing protein [Pseudomonas sp. MAP12]|uniref:SPOR domain-containing protein n=1 Tax=Geopseudomonas aromaticivorans TaxID=2849492 RepID=A0ABS6N1D0_9GAMM|nr:SPOR domain-containing protein [Pseudomonas aromaticivorans]MBV2134610.1 SPOR domain-containing protein [Pseudomonas aromaticivorans]
MALLDRRFKQRIVGAAVLVVLVVVFLPMLFNREDAQRRVRVEAPPMPSPPQVVVATPEPVVVPEPQAEPEAPPVAEVAPPAGIASPPPVTAAEPAAAAPAVDVPARPVVQTPAAAVDTPADEPSRLDADGLPISWAIQLASLSSRERAAALQQKLRSQGFTAYIRSVDGMHRVFVGPLLERAEAERVGGQLARQHKLSPIVVRFQPERR